MEPYDGLYDDVDTLVSFLEQVDQFTFLYEELQSVDERVSDEDMRNIYREVLHDDMRFLYHHGINEQYDEVSEAYQRLDRFVIQLEDTLLKRELDAVERQMGDPEELYGSLLDLVSTFESIDSDSFGDRVNP